YWALIHWKTKNIKPIMRKCLLTLSLFLTPILIFAQEQSTSEKIDIVFKKYTNWFVELIFYKIPFTDTIQIPWVLFVLIGGALYFTIYFKLINITGFATAIRVIR